MNITSPFLFESRRHFQLWKFDVGHNQLLLRSNPSHRYKSRVEVLFKGVEWLNMPTDLDGLKVQEVDSAEIQRRRLTVDGEFDKRTKLFLLTTTGFDCFVAALGFWTIEETKEYWEPSSLFVE